MCVSDFPSCDHFLGRPVSDTVVVPSPTVGALRVWLILSDMGEPVNPPEKKLFLWESSIYNTFLLIEARGKNMVLPRDAREAFSCNLQNRISSGGGATFAFHLVWHVYNTPRPGRGKYVSLGCGAQSDKMSSMGCGFFSPSGRPPSAALLNL
ncbi:hypothetical protein K474DRAFT_1190692 [Panus rudis PR-1116 ss-1]|nr:hypothetical protein K474DRAFT_1190692 [Panus rudis PR-1116 ss-1]